MTTMLYPQTTDAERNPIVQVHDGHPMADSRDVAAYFGKQHNHVLRDIRALHCSDEFFRANFGPKKIKDLTGESTSHVLMTKDGFVFLALGFTGGRAGTFKERFIGEFNRMETELRRGAVDASVLLNDPAALRGLLLGYTEKVALLESHVGELAPKAEALGRIAESDGSFCITDAAKTLQVRPKTLFSFLRAHRWIYTRPGGSSEVAYQDKLASGLLEHKTTTVTRSDGSEKTVTQVRVTPKGLARLAQELPPVAEAVA